MRYCMHCMDPLEDSDNFCTSCGKNISDEIPGHHLIPDGKLNNRYIVGKSIGEGGFGITYIGRDSRVNRKVAIKEYYPNGFVNRTNTVSSTVICNVSDDKKAFFEKGKKRFLEEAETLGDFSSESGIVQVSDYFEENGTAYIVMEYLEGKTLKDFICDKEKLTVAETIKYLRPVMKVLEKIHNKGLIHRDISPDNIMIVGEQVKLLDFGLAREFLADTEKSYTTSLKHGYAPIEQYQGRGIQGPWTDVYAMCATMYKCITGVTPDRATDRVSSDVLKSPSELEIIIDDSKNNAIMKGLSISYENRFQNMSELMNALDGVPPSPVIIPDEKKETNKTLIVTGIVVIAFLIIIIVLLLLKSCAKKETDNQPHIETTEQSFLESTENDGDITISDNETTKDTENIESDSEILETETAESEITEKETPEFENTETTESEEENTETETESETEKQTEAQWSGWVDELPANITSKDYEIKERKVYRTRLREITSSTEKSNMEGWELFDTVEADGNFGPWSNWSDTKVESSADREVETQTQYSYRDKETTTGTSDTMSGWTLYDTTYKWSNYGAWSSWSTSAVTGSDSKKVETKKQYRYRDKETTTGTSKTMSGWTLYDTTYKWSDYGAWSSWSTSAVTGSDSRKVESKKQYSYRSKETTTGSSSTMSGWTLYDTTYAWSDYGAWSDWTTDVLHNSDSRKVESKTQYSYRDITYSTVYTDWGAWTDWTLEQQATSDLKKEESRTAWEYYYFVCPTCGMHMHGYNVCYKWAGGCGSYIPLSSGVVIQSEISWDAAGLQDWHGTGKLYTYINGQLVFKYTDGPNAGVRTQYRYAERSTQQVANYSNWSDWGDTVYSPSANREVQTRTIYRCCDRSNIATYYFYRWGSWSGWSDTAYSANENKEVQTRTVYRYRDRSNIATYHFYRWGRWSSWSDTAYSANENKEVQTRTVYRYCERSKIVTYHFYRWGNWSSWSVNKVTANDNRQVKETTFYRYRERAKTKTYYFRRWTEWSEFSEQEVTKTENVEVDSKIQYSYRLK